MSAASITRNRQECYDCGHRSMDWVYARRANGQDVTHSGVSFTYDYYPVCNSRADCMKRRGINPQEHPYEAARQKAIKARALAKKRRHRRLHPPKRRAA